MKNKCNFDGRNVGKFRLMHILSEETCLFRSILSRVFGSALWKVADHFAVSLNCCTANLIRFSRSDCD